MWLLRISICEAAGRNSFFLATWNLRQSWEAVQDWWRLKYTHKNTQYTYLYMNIGLCFGVFALCKIKLKKKMSRPEFQNGVQTLWNTFQPIYNALGLTLNKVKKLSPLVIEQSFKLRFIKSGKRHKGEGWTKAQTRAQSSWTLGVHLLLLTDDLNVAYTEFKVAWKFLF